MIFSTLWHLQLVIYCLKPACRAFALNNVLFGAESMVTFNSELLADGNKKFCLWTEAAEQAKQQQHWAAYQACLIGTHTRTHTHRQLQRHAQQMAYKVAAFGWKKKKQLSTCTCTYCPYGHSPASTMAQRTHWAKWLSTTPLPAHAAIRAHLYLKHGRLRWSKGHGCRSRIACWTEHTQSRPHTHTHREISIGYIFNYSIEISGVACVIRLELRADYIYYIYFSFIFTFHWFLFIFHIFG